MPKNPPGFLANNDPIRQEEPRSNWRNPDGTLKRPRRPPLVDPTRSRVTGYVYKKKAKTSRRTPDRPPTSGKGVDTTEKPVQVDTDSKTKWEIYRKISYAIITQTEGYELPPGWDDTQTSPTWDNDLPDPGEPWFKQERVHEIGYITENKEIIKEKMHIPTLSYQISSGFTGIELTVLAAGVNTDVPVESRIPNDLLTSSEAQAAIAQAQSEV